MVLLALIVFTAIVRDRLAGIPLERDEGEYAYAGQLILDGVAPYEAAYNMKFPGVYYAYALILAISGESVSGIRLGLLLVNMLSILLVFAIGRRLFDNLTAVLAAAVFALLTLDRWILGTFAHATHFVTVCALGGVLLLLQASDGRGRARFFAAGAMLGLAVLMKQHALFFVPLAAIVVWKAERSREDGTATTNLLALAAGSATPLAALIVVLGVEGVLARFWFWTVEYALRYVSQTPIKDALPSLLLALRTITRATLPLWLLGLIGIVLLSRRGGSQARWTVWSYSLAALLAVVPGFHFREHYFIVLLPSIALGAGFALSSTGEALERSWGTTAARAIVLGIGLTAALHFIVTERTYLFRMPPHQVSKERFGANPFVEAPEIARYIRERTGPDDRIAVLGSEPEIYFLSGRRSATGYIYTYPLMEPQPFAARMQQEMIDEIESVWPAYLVLVRSGTSWLARPDSERKILEWADRYMRDCYAPVGIADMVAPDRTVYAFDAEVARYRPVSESGLYVFRRRDHLAGCAPGG